MKKLKILLILCCFVSQVKAQRTKAELTFKDGTVKTGLGKLVGNKLKFRTSRKEKVVKYDFELLKKVKINYQDKTSTYVCLSVKGVTNPVVLEELVIGRVNLYRALSQGFVMSSGGTGGFRGNGTPIGHSYSIENIYVSKAQDTEVTYLGSNQLFSNNFKRAALKFFKDCSNLVKKIQNKEYKKKDIIEIVEYYNKDCK